MQPVILGYFFSNYYDGNKYISFQAHRDPRFFFSIFNQLLWDLWKGTCNYWYNQGMWYIYLVLFFFSSKTVTIITIHFAHFFNENTTPGTFVLESAMLVLNVLCNVISRICFIYLCCLCLNLLSGSFKCIIYHIF